MKKHIITLTIFNLIMLNGFAQTCFKSGYIINNEGDTIIGKVDYRTDDLLCSVCTFKSKDTEKTKYYPDDIYAYGFDEGRLFISKEINSKQQFLELIIESDVCIYYYHNMKSFYFIQRDNGRLSELKYDVNTIEIQKDDNNKKHKTIKDINSIEPKNDENFRFTSYDYKVKLTAYLKDEPDIINDINELDELNHKNLIHLIQKYEMLKGNEPKTNVHYTEFQKQYIELTVSLFNISYNYISQDELHLMYGIKHCIPVHDDRFFFEYGAQYSTDNYKSDSTTNNKQVFRFFKAPLSFKYQYPGEVFKPYVGIGCNLYLINDNHLTKLLQVPGFNVGVKANIYKNVHLSFDYGADFSTFTLYSNSTNVFFSHTATIGLSISL